MSFAAALQFAPAVLLGLFWRGASRVGAMAGLCGGFSVWFYTLLLPSFAKSGWLGGDWLLHGPCGLEALRPEQLFGLAGLDPISHCVFWSMVANISLLLLGSLALPPRNREVQQAELFVSALKPQSGMQTNAGVEADIPLLPKLDILDGTLREVFPPDEAHRILHVCRKSSGVGRSDDPDQVITIVELTRLVRYVEDAIGEAVGTSAAGYMLRQSGVYDRSEFQQLTTIYADLLANMRLSPDELTRRIDYYQEKERLQQQHAQELEGQIWQRTRELEHTLGQLKKAQDSMVQSEKMASIGMLSAGVAHEINNPVGFISSNLNRLAEYAVNLQAALKLDSTEVKTALAGSATGQDLFDALRGIQEDNDIPFIIEDMPDLVAESIEGTERIRSIVGELKVYSHADENQQSSEDLHQIIDRALNMAHNELKYTCKVIKSYGDLPEIRCQANRLGQVFLNLLVNAGHAIETEGTITIETGCDDERVWVSVGDTGKGIEPEHQTKIFDPFFTTKDVGEGTGLGLHLSYNIIRAHDGHIVVNSEPGEGTTFVIKIPAGTKSETK